MEKGSRLIHGTYSLCGIALRVCVDEAARDLLPFLERLVYAHSAEKNHPGTPGLSLRFSCGAPQSPAEAKIVYQSLRLSVSRTPKGFYLRCGGSCLDIDVGLGEASGALSDGFWREPLESRREFLLLGLLMLVRRDALYGLHANGVSYKGRGVLFVGDSGSGKTTLTLACLRAGWSCISDDALVLHSTTEAVEALAYRRGFSCDQDLSHRFPELGPFAETAPVVASRKRLVNLETVFSGQFAARCVPKGIFFPRVGAEHESHLVSMGATTALTRLIQQSPGILTQPEFAQPQLETLRQLVEQAPAFELISGTDIFGEPSAVQNLLGEACKAA